nr:uncharacterized protein LOC109173041 [Ipomoea batatas]
MNLCQHKYALDILNYEVGFTNCKPTSTPMVPSHRLMHGDGEALQDAGSYRRVGSLHGDLQVSYWLLHILWLCSRVLEIKEASYCIEVFLKGGISCSDYYCL